MRELLDAYFEAKEAHTQLHKLTGAFKEGANVAELQRMTREVKATVSRLSKLVERAAKDAPD